jgi:hypothetical protein
MRDDSAKVRRAASKPSSRKPSSGHCSEQGVYVLAFGGNGVPVDRRTAQARPLRSGTQTVNEPESDSARPM